MGMDQCENCGRTKATAEDWDRHAPGCECGHCLSRCWGDNCEDTRSARIAELEAENERLRAALASAKADFDSQCDECMEMRDDY